MSKKKILIILCLLAVIIVIGIFIFLDLRRDKRTTNGNQNINQEIPVQFDGKENVNINLPPNQSTLSFQNSTTLTTDKKFYQEHDVYGDYVVWAQENPKNFQVSIYVYNVKTKQGRFIATGRYPAIYEDKVVYIDVRPEAGEELWESEDVYLYDLTTNQEYNLGRCTDDRRQPSIYKNKIVWSDNFEPTSRINLYDFDTKKLTIIATLSIHESSSPIISDNNIVWYDNGGIYVYDLNTHSKQKINTKIADVNEKIAIRGNILVGTDNKNLYLYDLNTQKEELIASSTYIDDVHLSENYIVWTDNRNANAKRCSMIANSCNDIYLYDLKIKKGYRVTSEEVPVEYTTPKIYGQQLIWSYTGDLEVDKLPLYYTELVIK